MGPKFKIGDKVQSTYRKFWYGDIIGVKSYTYKHKRCYIYAIKITHTVDGRPQRIRGIHYRNEYWVREIPATATLKN